MALSSTLIPTCDSADCFRVLRLNVGNRAFSFWLKVGKMPHKIDYRLLQCH